MKITERLQADMEKDDAKFVRAVADKSAHEERLQKLSKDRRLLARNLIIQMPLSLLMLFIDLFPISVSNGRMRSLSFLTITMGGAALAYLAYFFYLDLQIKFLKAVASD